jgi:hypothetical protein
MPRNLTNQICHSMPTARRRLAQLMSSHGKRGAWLARMQKAGYLWEPKQ